MSDALRKGSLYILLAALLTGSLWRGAYFPTPTTAFGFPGSLFTPRWSLVALLFTAGAWELVALVRERQAGMLRSPILWLFNAFAVFSGASYFWSSLTTVTIRDFLLLLSLLSVLIVMRGQQLRFPAKAAGMVASWLVYTASFVAAWGIVTYILQLAPYANEVDGIYRAGGTLEYSNGLGCFALMAIPFTAALMRQGNKDDRLLLGAALILLNAAVLLSLSRMALMLLVLVSIYLLIANRRSTGLVLVFTSLVFGIGIAAVSMLSAETGLPGSVGIVFAAVTLASACYFQSYLLGAGRGKALKISYVVGAALLLAAAAGTAATARARNIIDERFGEGFTLERLLPHREDTWAGALDAFRERPVKGWGLGSFPQVYQEFSFTSYTKYAHNLVLQAAVDSGVIGAALIALFLLYVVVLSLLRLVRHAGSLTRAAAITALVFILFNMFDWEWYLPVLAAWFMASTSLLEPGCADAAVDRQVS